MTQPDWREDPAETRRGSVQKPRRKHKPKPPPTPPPPKPQPSASWTLRNGPWIFVESDPGSCPQGPWTRLDITPNLIAPGAPLWHCAAGFVPQAEGGGESDACIAWLDKTGVVIVGNSVAPVTTDNIDTKPYLQRGVTSCFAECYIQNQPYGLRNLVQAKEDGWIDPIACIGVYDGVTVAAYIPANQEMGWPGLPALGKRFGVYACDAMSADDWQTLTRLVS